MDTNTITLLVVGALALGGALYAVLHKIGRKLLEKFKERAPLVKKYWTFVVPLAMLTAVAYTIVAIYFYGEIGFSLVGQVSGFLLAIFVGYIAFAEFGESKFDKLKESGMAALNRNEISSAKALFEEAHAIKPKEVNLLGNLLEVYVILGFYDKFDAKVKLYEKNVIEDNDKLAVPYLYSLRYLMEQRIGDAEHHISTAIAFVNDKPSVRQRFTWSNEELISSDSFEKLQPSVKKIVKNLFNFLKQRLVSEDEVKFKSGNYELTK